MMNQTAMRMWDAGFSMLSPSYMIDRFLDRIEQLGNALMASAQADNSSRPEIPTETRLDQFGA